MPSKNIYLPDELMEQLKILGSDLNVSALVQELLRQKLESHTGTCSRCDQPLPVRRGF